MKNNKKYLIVLLTVVLAFLLAACNNFTDQSSAGADEQSQNIYDESSNVDSTEDAANTANNNNNEKVDTPKTEPPKVEDTSKTTTMNIKEEYLKKLKDTKKVTDEMEAESTATYALKAVEDDRWDIWDDLLNEVYGVLNEQLPPNEMDKLRQEQRDWINHRDDTALEASVKYKGTTSEHLEYSTISADLTEERCFELVKEYM
ncbi:lysozyme inhibitor LprI family protein [Bacillus sp. JJ1521]|uniref:lysozyme inhibitor LprI family protein n=1 Tax=Bacillus sp. JJ1521 TaxID=3122957 RepID=UPI002FFDEFF1